MQGDTVRVDAVMQKNPLYVDGLSSVADALALMREKSVSSLIIEKRHDGDEFGFLTVTEIATRVIAPGRPLERTSVYEVMEKPVLAIAPGMQVKYAVRLLAQLGRRRAIVADDSGILGYVSLRDLVLSYGARSPDTAPETVRQTDADPETDKGTDPVA